MIRKNKNIAVGKRIFLICILLTAATLLGGCRWNIPQTQKHNYTDTPYEDYRLTDIPEFVDELSLCTDTEKQYVLPDGYLYEYRSSFVYNVTNQLAIATDVEGSLYQGCGYLSNARLRSTFETEESDYAFVTGFIPIKAGDVIYFSNNLFNSQHQKAGSMNIAFYDADYQAMMGGAMLYAEKSYFEILESNADGYASAVKLSEQKISDQISYIRLTLIGSGEGKIVSVNEPLDEGHEELAWVQAEKYVSDLWYQEIRTTVDAVRQIYSSDASDIIRFLFSTDIHLNPDSNGSYTENLGKVCAEVMRACDIPFFVSGGDNCTQSSDFMPSVFQSNMEAVLNQLLPISQKNILLTVGNHDGATGWAYDQNGDKVHYRFQLNNEERSEVFFCWQRDTNVNKRFDSDGTYYYMDDPLTKTRYIVLNSFWSQWQGNSESYVYNVQHNFFLSPSFGSRQLHWFAEEALDMPADYGAIIITHSASAAKDFEIFKGIVDAFSSQTTYKGKYKGVEDWQSVNIAVNYKNANGEIIAVFQGHNHTDADLDCFESGPCICMTTTGAYADVRDENAEDRIKGTSSEFAIDVVTIDKTARKIYLTRLGVGEDRIFEY